MANAAIYWVMIGADQGRLWPLSIDPVSMAEAKRAVAWQHRGGNSETMHICHYDKEARKLVSETGQAFDVPTERGAFTEAAFARFTSQFD